jgi:hypothetical protein
MFRTDDTPRQLAFDAEFRRTYPPCFQKLGEYLPPEPVIQPRPPVHAGPSWDSSIRFIKIQGNSYDISLKYRIMYEFADGKFTRVSGETSEIFTRGIGMPMMKFVGVPDGAKKVHIFRHIDRAYKNTSMGSLIYSDTIETMNETYKKIAVVNLPVNVWFDTIPFC